MTNNDRSTLFAWVRDNLEVDQLEFARGADNPDGIGRMTVEFDDPSYLIEVQVSANELTAEPASAVDLNKLRDHIAEELANKP